MRIRTLWLCRALLLTIYALFSTSVTANEEKPLWEIGAGLATLSFPAYRGSDATYTMAIPMPYFTYHGDFLKADRHGIRGSLFDSDLIDLSLSFAASPPTDKKIGARVGMDDLHATVEIGPEIDWTIWRNEYGTRSLKLQFPLRGAITVERSPKAMGLIFSPHVNIDITDLTGLVGWNLGLVVGPIFASQKQHEFFYGVDERNAIATRPAYRPSGGYSGSQLLIALSKRFNDFWLGAYVRADNLRGTAFDNSPLLIRKSYTSAGFAISYIFAKSSERVFVED